MNTKKGWAQCGTAFCLVFVVVCVLAVWGAARSAEDTEDITDVIEGTIKSVNTTRFPCSKKVNSQCASGNFPRCIDLQPGENTFCTDGGICCIDHSYTCPGNFYPYVTRSRCERNCKSVCYDSCDVEGAERVEMKWGVCSLTWLRIEVFFTGGDNIFNESVKTGFDEEVTMYRPGETITVYHNTRNESFSIFPPEDSSKLYTKVLWFLFILALIIPCFYYVWKSKCKRGVAKVKLLTVRLKESRKNHDDLDGMKDRTFPPHQPTQEVTTPEVTTPEVTTPEVTTTSVDECTLIQEH